ncbi:hypothetical protein INT43_003269 [Umbelopsis isabellina]|uniref:Lariat debranching enzyme C-terminal domain-containing protein n=1 Tax=Mortierella isabellina TaxID=91625 RepID=A0A8H7PQ44_MORIS|nr:hypothetical protein INT43_003269 [Umbelopsis isabellina]
MKIAVEGCCHGQLDDIYGSIRLLEHKEEIKIDLVLICGDFQAIRNVADLECMAVPPKYRQLGTFHKYYSGSKVVPYPTIFIGGNHEASNYLWELYYGGWAAQNLYFLGWGGVINFGGVRIAGSSGIFKGNHYRCGHYEKAPYSSSDLRSIYHVRQYDIRKLGLLRQPIDIMLTHDWPRGVEQFGDVQKLLRVKKYFRQEVARNELGSPANEELLEKLHPKYWFSAHLHVKFAAIVNHDDWVRRNDGPVRGSEHNQQAQTMVNPDEIVIAFDDDDMDTPAPNPDEITIDFDEAVDAEPSTKQVQSTVDPNEIIIDDDFDDIGADEIVDTNEGVIDIDEEISKKVPAANATDISHNVTTPHDELINENTEKTPMLDPSETKATRFLSLDKCLPGRQFLQVLDVATSEESFTFQYDLEWLAITQVTNKYLSMEYGQPPLPSDESLYRYVYKEPAKIVLYLTTLASEVAEKMEELQQKVANGTIDLAIPHNFVPTTPAHDDSKPLTRQEVSNYVYPFTNPQTESFCQKLEIENKFKSSNTEMVPPMAQAVVETLATEETAPGDATPPKRPRLDLPSPKGNDDIVD